MSDDPFSLTTVKTSHPSRADTVFSFLLSFHCLQEKGLCGKCFGIWIPIMNNSACVPCPVMVQHRQSRGSKPRSEYRVPSGRPAMSRTTGQFKDWHYFHWGFPFSTPDHALPGSSKRLDVERFDPANNNENRDLGRNTSQSYRNVTFPPFFVICLVVLG